MENVANEPACTCDARHYPGLGITTHAPTCQLVTRGLLKCPTCGEPWIDCPHTLNAERPPETIPDWEKPRLARGARDGNPLDLAETIDRARLVINILERCATELALLEMIPSADPDDVNALSAAKGFVSRARNALRGRFQ